MHDEARSWRRSVIRYLRDEAQPVDKFGHQPRLYALARDIGAALSYDDDVIFAAAWLHDLGVFRGHRPENPVALAAWDNVAYAIEQTPAILLRFGFPEGKIDAVLDAIRTHQADQRPLTLEGTILRDGDILEQLGAMGILRSVAKVGRDTRYATFSDIVPVLVRALEVLPQQLTLPSSRALAVPRVEALSLFLKAVALEARGELH